jgi:hypothetical protein
MRKVISWNRQRSGTNTEQKSVREHFNDNIALVMYVMKVIHLDIVCRPVKIEERLKSLCARKKHFACSVERYINQALVITPVTDNFSPPYRQQEQGTYFVRSII